ncbi:MAG TPA: hypothetical protein VGR43_09555 [Dehalococcoidia bacterium]|nr:hypothetical protein [Dehalococcoidia bacterium]
MLGNLTQKSEGTNPSCGADSMAYGAGAPGPHAITSANGSDGNHTFQYDAMGNMTVEWINGTTVRHQYATTLKAE